MTGAAAWGAGTYGDPCVECGFAWTTDPGAAIDLVRGLPARLDEAMEGATGPERLRGPGWSVGGYVCHMADNLRTWAERVVGASAAGGTPVVPYDADLLATARRYDSISLASARWSLAESVDAWLVVVESTDLATTLLHPDRGLLGVSDIVLGNAHDVSHHEWDIARALAVDPDRTTTTRPSLRKQYHFWPGRNGLDAWDVDRLIELVDGLPAQDVAVASIGEIDTVYWFDEHQPPTVRKVVEHSQLMAAADLSYPIILGPDGRVMDGMHRVARATLEGRRTIRAVRLPELPAPDFTDCTPDELPY
jgi:hypothetical protein